MINAEVHSDDGNVKTDFDATPWFEYASEKQIIELARCDWGGEKPADIVAEFCSDTDENVKNVFNYLEAFDRSSSRNPPGFKCHVDKVSARVWIEANYPKLMGHK